MARFLQAGDGYLCDACKRKRRGAKENLETSRRKLEDMVAYHLRSGRENLGQNLCVLAQSRLVDKLIIEEMLLGNH